MALFQDNSIENARRAGFPNCKGLYPDCPEFPEEKEHPCKNCPVLDEDF